MKIAEMANLIRGMVATRPDREPNVEFDDRLNRLYPGVKEALTPDDLMTVSLAVLVIANRDDLAMTDLVLRTVITTLMIRNEMR